MTEAQYTIEELLPHRPPMILVDELLQAEDSNAVVRYRVKENPFVRNNCFSMAGIMEHMAQSCAARIGYHRWLNHLQPQPGMIIAVRSMSQKRRIAVGDELCTYVHEETTVMDMVIMTCETRIADQVVVTAELRLKV